MELKKALNRKICGFSGGMILPLGIDQAVVSKSRVHIQALQSNTPDPTGRYIIIGMIDILLKAGRTSGATQRNVILSADGDRREPSDPGWVPSALRGIAKDLVS